MIVLVMAVAMALVWTAPSFAQGRGKGQWGQQGGQTWGRGQGPCGQGQAYGRGYGRGNCAYPGNQNYQGNLGNNLGSPRGWGNYQPNPQPSAPPVSQ
jgi:hypothetical protein